MQLLAWAYSWSATLVAAAEEGARSVKDAVANTADAAWDAAVDLKLAAQGVAKEAADKIK